MAGNREADGFVKSAVKIGLQPILPVILPVKKIKGAACQRCVDGDEVVWRE